MVSDICENIILYEELKCNFSLPNKEMFLKITFKRGSSLEDLASRTTKSACGRRIFRH
jgi:hypothetical protein